MYGQRRAKPAKHGHSRISTSPLDGAKVTKINVRSAGQIDLGQPSTNANGANRCPDNLFQFHAMDCLTPATATVSPALRKLTAVGVAIHRGVCLNAVRFRFKLLSPALNDVSHGPYDRQGILTKCENLLVKQFRIASDLGYAVKRNSGASAIVGEMI